MKNKLQEYMISTYLKNLEDACKLFETDDKEFVLNWIYEQYPEPYKTEMKPIFNELYRRILL